MKDDERSLPEGDANSGLSRRQFLTTVGTGAAAAMLARYGIQLPAQAAETKPNIILILADDLGYGELGCQGFTKDIPTPNIDSITRNGVRFTDGHVSCPVCAPTRAGLMTGRYQERFGLELNPGPPQSASPNFGLIKTETTIAERLKPLGYTTGMFGKWHLGYTAGLQPPDRGFDEFFGFLAGAHDYLNPLLDSPNPIMRGREKVDEKEYLTDALAREASAFIERHKGEPFFCYLPFNAVHAPLQAPQKYLDRFTSIQDNQRRTFAAMLSAMDDGIGKVLAKVREHRLEERTLVIFLSDNGGPTRQTSSGNGPLSGFKGQVLEGGTRVAFMMQWKGQLPAGKVLNDPVISLDIHPTVFAAAGGTLPADAKLDGVNLLPSLKGESKQPPHDRLFWRYGQQWAVRMGEWKLLNLGAGQAPQLYNLKQDLGEKRDLATEKVDKAKELQTVYDGWAAQLPPAPTQGRGTRRAGARAGNRAGNRAGRRNRANAPAPAAAP